MLGGILNYRVLCRTFGVAAKFCSRFGREVKFYCAEFRSEAPKSRLYKILKPRFYTLKFYAHRSLKFCRRSCGLYSAIPNTHSLKFYDRAAEFLQDKALKFYRGAARKIRVAKEFSKITKFHHIKFRYAVKFYRIKFYLIAKFYRSAEFKRLQHRKMSTLFYARRGFCK